MDRVHQSMADRGRAEQVRGRRRPPAAAALRGGAMGATRGYAGMANRGTRAQTEGGAALRPTRGSRCALGLWPRMAGARCPRDSGGGGFR